MAARRDGGIEVYDIGNNATLAGYSLDRISSEMTVTFSISSTYLCNRRKSAGVMILPSTTRGEWRADTDLWDRRDARA